MGLGETIPQWNALLFNTKKLIPVGFNWSYYASLDHNLTKQETTSLHKPTSFIDLHG
jgi:hypothetical protein